MLGISLVPKQLFASQEALRSMQLVEEFLEPLCITSCLVLFLLLFFSRCHTRMAELFGLYGDNDTAQI
jgi:hypothetical protein